jgi:hypothetical protein
MRILAPWKLYITLDELLEIEKRLKIHKKFKKRNIIFKETNGVLSVKVSNSLHIGKTIVNINENEISPNNDDNSNTVEIEESYFKKIVSILNKSKSYNFPKIMIIFSNDISDIYFEFNVGIWRLSFNLGKASE